MKLKCIMSGSEGNFYTLVAKNGKTLLLECGIKFDKICEHIDSWRNVVGCIESHGHQDHCKAHNDLIKRNIKVYSADNTQPLKWFNIGEFRILAIPTPHSIECFSFIIECEGKRIFFATDTSNISIKPNQKFDLVMIETNYIDSVVNERIENGEDIRENYLSHLSLEQAKDWLEQLEYKPKQVVAIHLSKNNCDKSIVLEELKDFDIKIASKNLEVEI